MKTKALYILLSVIVLILVVLFVFKGNKKRITPPGVVIMHMPDSASSGSLSLDTVQNIEPKPHPVDEMVVKNSSGKKRDKGVPTDVTGVNEEGKISDTIEPRSGLLGYSYFPHMLQHETRSIFAYISINNPRSLIISKVRNLNSDEIPVRQSDTFTVSTYDLNMLLYKFVEVKLLQNDSDFIIRPVHRISRQQIDNSNGNKWEWNITPVTDKEHANLTLNVVAEKPDGNLQNFDSRNIPIDITIDKALVRHVWDWMMNNPGKTLTIVIIPLVAFFGQKIFGSSKKEGKPQKNEVDTNE